MEKGKRKWVGIINYIHVCAYTCILSLVYTCLNENKKGGETSKSKNSANLKRGNIGIANMHKKYRKQDRDPGWLGHTPAR